MPKSTTHTVPASSIGFEKDGVLNALKNSARNSKPRASLCPKATFLMIEMSKSCCAGPITLLEPPLPNAVTIPSAPIIGGTVKHPGLKYPSSAAKNAKRPPPNLLIKK